MKFDPFLLDRLTGCRQVEGHDGMRQQLTLSQVKDSVARDLESLLNTRTGLQPHELRDRPHAARSVITFGLRDFVGLSLDNPEHREGICQSIASAIQCHERRLTAVRVRLIDTQQLGLGLRFAIHATLVINPAIEPVSFDALLQPTTMQYSVSRLRRAAAA